MKLVKVSSYVSNNRLRLMLILKSISSPRNATRERVMDFSPAVGQLRLDEPTLFRELVAIGRPILLDRPLITTNRASY